MALPPWHCSSKMVMRIIMKGMVMVLPWVGSCFFSWPEWGSCKRGLSSGDEKCSIQNASDSVRLWISGGFVVVFGGGVVLIVALECTVSTILWIGGGGGFGINCVEWCLVETLALDQHQKSVLPRIGAVGAMRQINLEPGIERELGIATWNRIGIWLNGV